MGTGTTRETVVPVDKKQNKTKQHVFKFFIKSNICSIFICGLIKGTLFTSEEIQKQKMN